MSEDDEMNSRMANKNSFLDSIYSNAANRDFKDIKSVSCYHNMHRAALKNPKGNTADSCSIYRP